MKLPQESQGRLSFGGRIRWSVLIALPTAFALVAGAGLAYHALSPRIERTDAERIREISALARVSSEQLLDEVSAIRAQTLAIREFQRADSPDLLPSFFSQILCAAELELREGAAPLVSRLLRRPTGNGAGTGIIDEKGIIEATEKLTWAELAHQGIAALRLKPDPTRPSEWLALVFPLPGSAHLAALAVVDPMEAFPLFARWKTQNADGNLRAFLLGKEGVVFAHSQHNYLGADFASTEVFQQGAGPLFDGKQSFGSGQFLAIDQTPSRAYFSKITGIPWVLVVENTAPEAMGPLGSSDAVSGPLSRVFWALLWVLLALSGLIYLVSSWLRGEDQSTFNEKPLGQIKQKEIAEIQTLQAALTSESAGGAQVAGPPIWVGARQAALPSALPPEVDKGLYKIQEIQPQKKEEEPAAARHGLAKLTDLAWGLCRAPSLFFAIDREKNRAVLASFSGLEAELLTPRAEYVFPLGADIPNKIMAATRTGQLLSMSEYIPLASLLMRRMQVLDFQAWAVTGARTGNFFGVLVVLGGDSSVGTEDPENAKALARLMRSMGALYENAYPEAPRFPPGAALGENHGRQ